MIGLLDFLTANKDSRVIIYNHHMFIVEATNQVHAMPWRCMFALYVYK
jgi:hypothetical protein